MLALLAWLTSCQSSGPAGQQALEAGEGSTFSFTLHPQNTDDQLTWDASLKRKVWFELKRANGEPVPSFINGVFLADDGAAATQPVLDPTRLQLTVQKDTRHGYLVRNVENQYSSLLCGSPGHYLLKFHVECHDQGNQLVYTGATDMLRLNISSEAPAHPPQTVDLALAVTAELKTATDPAAAAVAPAPTLPPLEEVLPAGVQ